MGFAYQGGSTIRELGTEASKRRRGNMRRSPVYDRALNIVIFITRGTMACFRRPRTDLNGFHQRCVVTSAQKITPKWTRTVFDDGERCELPELLRVSVGSISSAVRFDSFGAISLRCHASRVSGVTRLATSASSLRLRPLARTAKRRRWSSLKRNRRSPSCSRSTRFSSCRYSMTCCCR